MTARAWAPGGLPCGPRPSIPSRKVPPKLPRTGRLQLGVSLPTIPRAGPPSTGRALLPLARAGVSPGAEGGPPPARPDHQQASRPHPKVLTCPEAALSAQQHEPQHEPPSRHVPPSRRPAVPPSPRNRRPRHYKNRSAAGRAHAGGVAGGGGGRTVSRPPPAHARGRMYARADPADSRYGS